MIATERKPIDEIIHHMADESAALIVACTGCPEGCESGSQEQLARLRQELEGAGKRVVEVVAVDFLCNKQLVARRLGARLDALEEADSLVVVSCGVGVQAVAATVDKVTHAALNTISMGGFQGLWPSNERCAECGECVLDWTGGICPWSNQSMASRGRRCMSTWRTHPGMMYSSCTRFMDHSPREKKMHLRSLSPKKTTSSFSPFWGNGDAGSRAMYLKGWWTADCYSLDTAWKTGIFVHCIRD